ncbi:MAG: GNAT family N-acetyltransferase [Thermoleophilaceae bacterium]
MSAEVAVPELETARLRLRPWRAGDIDAWAEINADPQVREYLYPRRPLTRTEAEAEIEQLRAHWQRLGFGHWAVELRETGELVGRTGARRHADWDLDPENTEVGWLYARSVWGQGLATEGALAVVEFCLEQLGRPEVISIAHVDNLASHRVMQRAGLEWAGVRRWHERSLDVVWYSSRRTAAKTGDPRRRGPYRSASGT